MAAAAAIATLASAGMQAFGAIHSGKAQQAALNFEAKQHEKQAAEERAAAQREAEEKKHEGKLLQSRQIALAASGGAGVVNPSILDIYSETAEESDLNARAVQYGGESRARGQLDQAAAARAKGKAARTGSIFEAGGLLLGGIGKAYG
jgi:hypothetical protein